MEKIKIAIIDSGVDNAKNYDGASICYDEETQKFNVDNDYFDENGHGTIVANIIKSHTSNTELYILKIFEDQEEVETEKLIFALKFLNFEIHPDIIHLSMGVSFCNDIKSLREICFELTNNGTIIVAAFDNNGALSYPASFPFVIGVESNSKILKSGDYYYLTNSPINIAAIGIAQRLKGLGNMYYDVVGSSFAAPYITSIIAEMMLLSDHKMSIDEIMQKLKNKSKKIYDAKELAPIKKPFEMHKAIVFPYNKEINTLLRYSENHIFDTEGIYDVKFLKNIGKKIHIGEKEFVVEAFEKINWESNFDFIILGHMKELELISGRKYTDYIIENCIKYRKNIYSFDELSIEQMAIIKNSSVQVFTPKVTKENIPLCYDGRLRQIGKPIICVAGTSNKQGKFSLQLQLKAFFEKQLNVGFLSTEPSGYLLGADMVYPMGYNSTIDFEDGGRYISTVNYVLGTIEDNDVDLIITGLQSQTIPNQLCHLRDTVIYNHYFLLGINPDAIVLTVNVFDEIEQIERTINYLENIIICDVVAIVIFPIMRSLKWNTIGELSSRYDDTIIIDFKNELMKHFNKRVFVLDDKKDIENLSNLCLKHFLE